jgi:hypothetical protein
MIPLLVRPAGEADIADAALWYEARALGLGTEFLRAVDVALAEIQRMPGRFPIVHLTCQQCPTAAVSLRYLLRCDPRGDPGDRLSACQQRPTEVAGAGWK